MTVGVVLLAYAASITRSHGGRVSPPPRSPVSTMRTRAPRLAIITYLAAAWSIVAALGLAGLTLAVHATALGGGLSHLIGACVLRLRATYATPGGAAVAGLGLTLAGGLAARVPNRHAAGYAGAGAPDRARQESRQDQPRAA